MKDVIATFLYSFNPAADDKRLIDSKKFDLSRQFEMLQAWQSSMTEGQLEAALCIGARLLFGADADTARIAKLLAPDARSIYIRTLHLFGRKADPRLLQVGAEAGALPSGHQP